MRVLSAGDAISPAIARTRLVLFSPFRLGRSWKLGITAYLAFASTAFIPFPLIYFGQSFAMVRSGHQNIGSFLLVCDILFLAVASYFFYLFSRLQFAFFDIVLNRGEFVAPAWRKYGSQTWPWMVAKILFGTVSLIVCVGPFFPALFSGFHQFAALNITPGQPPPPHFIRSILSLELGAFAVFGILFVIDSLLTDFVLPSFALENCTLTESFRRFGQLVRNEPGSILGYTALKTVVAIGGYIGILLIYIAVVLVFLLICGLVFGLGYLILHAFHVSGAVLAILGFVVAIPVYVFVVFYTASFGAGVLLTFLQAYALYFLGGRYPLIGFGLEASEPRPEMPYPVTSQQEFNPPPPMYPPTQV